MSGTITPTDAARKHARACELALIKMARQHATPRPVSELALRLAEDFHGIADLLDAEVPR